MLRRGPDWEEHLTDVGVKMSKTIYAKPPIIAKELAETIGDFPFSIASPSASMSVFVRTHQFHQARGGDIHLYEVRLYFGHPIMSALRKMEENMRLQWPELVIPKSLPWLDCRRQMMERSVDPGSPTQRSVK